MDCERVKVKHYTFSWCAVINWARMLESVLKAAAWITVFNIPGMFFCSNEPVVKERSFRENV